MSATIPIALEVKEKGSDAATKNLKALETEMKSLEDTAKKSSKSMKESGKEVEDFGKQAEKGASSLKSSGDAFKGLGGTLSSISPGISALSTNLSTATSTAQGLVGAFGPLGLIVGGVTAAVAAFASSLQNSGDAAQRARNHVQEFRDAVLETTRAIQDQIDSEKEWAEIAGGRDGNAAASRLIIEAQEEIHRRQIDINRLEAEINRAKEQSWRGTNSTIRALEQQLQVQRNLLSLDQRQVDAARAARSESIEAARRQQVQENLVLQELRDQVAAQIHLNAQKAAAEADAAKFAQRRGRGGGSNRGEQNQRNLDRIQAAADRLNDSLEEQEIIEQRINDIRDLEISRARMKAENQELEIERLNQVRLIEEERTNIDKENQFEEAQFRAQALVDEERRNALVEKRNRSLMVGANLAREAVNIGRSLASLSQQAAMLAEQEGITRKEAMASVLKEWLKTFAIEQAFEGAANTIQAIVSYARQDYAAGTQFLAAAAGNFALAAVAGGASAAIPSASVGAAGSGAPQGPDSNDGDSEPREVTINIMGPRVSTDADVGAAVERALGARERRR